MISVYRAYFCYIGMPVQLTGHTTTSPALFVGAHLMCSLDVLAWPSVGRGELRIPQTLSVHDPQNIH